MFKLIAESTKAIPFTLNVTQGFFPYIGAQGIVSFDVPEEQWREPGALDRVIPRDSNPETRQRFDECSAGPFEFLTTLNRSNGQQAEVRWMGTCETAHAEKTLRGLILDVTEMRRLERELTAAQKLESVGRLAAGVAHEINTPVQFVMDNIGFVSDSISGMTQVIHAYRGLKQAVQTGGDTAALANSVASAESAADLDYALQNVPPAIIGAIEGLERIATIVRSMKEFAHPDQTEMSSADLNHAIQSTLIIARNEYKYVAEVETDFGDLPQVQCYLGEVNQVILNLLVNAAHAIADVIKDSGAMGRLTVRTRLDGDEVEIAIGDSGTGIPEAARERVFDPFFTTKEVGRGTGQGLAIARSVIVKKHGGTLRFETECGKGTTFFIRLPVGAHIDELNAAPVAA
jgi:two-component system NtrC family sensor kinase